MHCCGLSRAAPGVAAAFERRCLRRPQIKTCAQTQKPPTAAAASFYSKEISNHARRDEISVASNTTPAALGLAGSEHQTVACQHFKNLSCDWRFTAKQTVFEYQRRRLCGWNVFVGVWEHSSAASLMRLIMTGEYFHNPCKSRHQMFAHTQAPSIGIPLEHLNPDSPQTR